MGHVISSSGPFTSLVIFVEKKDGTMRMCINYRALKKITIQNSYSIPKIEELIDEIHGARYFLKINLQSRIAKFR